MLRLKATKSSSKHLKFTLMCSDPLSPLCKHLQNHQAQTLCYTEVLSIFKNKSQTLHGKLTK